MIPKQGIDVIKVRNDKIRCIVCHDKADIKVDSEIALCEGCGIDLADTITQMCLSEDDE